MVDRPSSLPAKPNFDALGPYFNPFGHFGGGHSDYNPSPSTYDFVHAQRLPAPVPVALPTYPPTSSIETFSPPLSDLEKLQRLKHEILAGNNAFFTAPPASREQASFDAVPAQPEVKGQQRELATETVPPTGPRAKRNRTENAQQSASDGRSKSDRSRKGEGKSQKRRNQPTSGSKEESEPKSATAHRKNDQVDDRQRSAQHPFNPSPATISTPAASVTSRQPLPSQDQVASKDLRRSDVTSPAQNKVTPVLVSATPTTAKSDQYSSQSHIAASQRSPRDEQRLEDEQLSSRDDEQIISVRRPESATVNDSRESKRRGRSPNTTKTPSGPAILSTSQRSDRSIPSEKTASNDRYSKRDPRRQSRPSTDSGPFSDTRTRRSDLDTRPAKESDRKAQALFDTQPRVLDVTSRERSDAQERPNEPVGLARSSSLANEGRELDRHLKLMEGREHARQSGTRLAETIPAAPSRTLGERLGNTRGVAPPASQHKRPAENEDHSNNASKRRLLDRVEPATGSNVPASRSWVQPQSDSTRSPLSRQGPGRDSVDDRPLSARLAAPPLSARITAPDRNKQSTEQDAFGRTKQPLKDRLAKEGDLRSKSNRNANDGIAEPKGASFVRPAKNAPPDDNRRGDLQRSASRSVSGAEPVGRINMHTDRRDNREPAGATFSRYPPEDQARDRPRPMSAVFPPIDNRPYEPPIASRRSALPEADRPPPIARDVYPVRGPPSQYPGPDRFNDRESYDRPPAPDRRPVDPRFQTREDVYRERGEPPRDWPPAPDRYMPPSAADLDYRPRSPAAYQRFDGERPLYSGIDPGYYPPPLPPADYDPYYERERYMHDRAAFDYEAGRPATSAFPGDRPWTYPPPPFEREGPYSAAASSFSRAPERQADLGPPLGYFGREVSPPPREAPHSNRGERGPPNELAARIEGQKESYTRRGGKAGNANGSGRGGAQQQQGGRKVSTGRGRGRGRGRGS